ncbi:MAG: dihydrodipicolinate reductase C-terminal domain-containing protein [Balneola sp.]|jgi:4-hydroxy-tetrahydrodipicolinate reductase
MKISVIGTGKTGGKVVELLGDNLAYAFDETNPPTVEKLKESDAVIIFVPGDAVEEILPMVLESGTPAAWGSTGFSWPEDLEDRVKKMGIKWVMATNFSLGMNIIRNAIEAISTASQILKNPSFKIHEVHHVHKKDAPSGTALSWKEWLNKEAEITSAREGDINGIHELTVTTVNEEITLKHDAKDRALFAEGAIWAAEQLIKNQNLTNGIYTFGQLFDFITKNNE